MTRFLLVCLGGALGSGARYLVALSVPRLLGTAFPYATLIVNVAGSFALAAMMHVALASAVISPNLRLFLATGVMGGFTTYSTFNYETLEYLRQGALWLAAFNVAGTTILCLLGAIAGLELGRWLVGN